MKHWLVIILLALSLALLGCEGGGNIDNPSDDDSVDDDQGDDDDGDVPDDPFATITAFAPTSAPSGNFKLDGAAICASVSSCTIDIEAEGNYEVSYECPTHFVFPEVVEIEAADEGEALSISADTWVWALAPSGEYQTPEQAIFVLNTTTVGQQIVMTGFTVNLVLVGNTLQGSSTNFTYTGTISEDLTVITITATSKNNGSQTQIVLTKV